MFRVALLLSTLACVLSWAPATYAKKCPFIPYHIEGIINLAENEVELNGLKVIVFLGYYKHPSAYPPTSKEKDFAVPEPSGRFEFKSHLSTTAADGSCTYVPRAGEVVFLGPGVRIQRRIFKLPRKKKVLQQGGASIDLGRVELTIVQED